MEEANKKVEADRTEEGPKLSLQEKVAWGYYIGELVTIAGLLKLSMVFLDLLAKPFDDLMKELNEQPFYRQWEGYIRTSILENK